jgi:hypothetical protein
MQENSSAVRAPTTHVEDADANSADLNCHWLVFTEPFLKISSICACSLRNQPLVTSGSISVIYSRGTFGEFTWRLSCMRMFKARCLPMPTVTASSNSPTPWLAVIGPARWWTRQWVHQLIMVINTKYPVLKSLLPLLPKFPYFIETRDLLIREEAGKAADLRHQAQTAADASSRSIGFAECRSEQNTNSFRRPLQHYI